MLAAWLAAVGCGPARPVGPQPGRVDVINLLPSPVAENFDDQPGPDGVLLRAYLYQLDKPLPVAADGTLELMLFEGSITAEGLAAARPLQVWSFTAAELKPYLRPDEYGLWCYQFALRWGRAPISARATLVGRYLPPAGPPVRSEPTSIVIRQQ
jgi:hypothetical protein